MEVVEGEKRERPNGKLGEITETFQRCQSSNLLASPSGTWKPTPPTTSEVYKPVLVTWCERKYTLHMLKRYSLCHV